MWNEAEADLTNRVAGSEGVECRIQRFLEALAASRGKPMEQMTPAEARKKRLQR